MAKLTSALGQTDVIGRQAEIPDANFNNGMNVPGSNASGIGINIGGGVVDENNFTLLDQQERPRTPQQSSHIGGTGFVDRATVAWPSSGGSTDSPNIDVRTWENGTDESGPTNVSEAYLRTLEVGWTEDTP